MAGSQDEYDLDAGSPHLQPDDYKKLGLGDFSRSEQYTDMIGDPTEEDQRLARDIESHLRDHNKFDRVEVRVVNKNVRLTGVVENRFERERAELAAREVAGIGNLHNDIHVQPPDEGGGPILTTHEPGTNKTGSTQRS